MHKDAYLFVGYEDPSTGQREFIWNSRDGRAPDAVSARNTGVSCKRVCDGARKRDHVPRVGERIWVKWTAENARRYACMIVDNAQDHVRKVFESLYETRDECVTALTGHVLNAGTGDTLDPDMDAYLCADLLTVTEGFLESFVQLPPLAAEPRQRRRQGHASPAESLEFLRQAQLEMNEFELADLKFALRRGQRTLDANVRAFELSFRDHESGLISYGEWRKLRARGTFANIILRTRELYDEPVFLDLSVRWTGIDPGDGRIYSSEFRIGCVEHDDGEHAAIVGHCKHADAQQAIERARKHHMFRAACEDLANVARSHREMHGGGNARDMFSSAPKAKAQA